MVELRSNKYIQQVHRQHRTVTEGDSPTADPESAVFDKVIELQATTSSSNASRPLRAAKLHERSTGSWQALPGVLTSVGRKLFTPRVRGLVLLNLVMLACASTFVVLKEGQDNINPFAFSSLRFVIAAIAFAPILRGGALKDPVVVRGGIELGIWAAGGYLTQSVGMVTADASRGAFLSGLTVVVVPVCAGLFGNGVKRATWGAVAVATLGIYLLEGSGTPPTWGDMWNFISAVSFSLQIFRAEHYTKVYAAKAALHMMAVGILVVAAISLVATVVVFPLHSLYFARNPYALLTLLTTSKLPWLEIIYLGVGVTNGGLYAEVIALQDVGSVEAAFIYTLEPVAGAALAYVWLGERWGVSGWVGAVLIVTSCLVAQLYGAMEDGHAHHGTHHHQGLADEEDPSEK